MGTLKFFWLLPAERGHRFYELMARRLPLLTLDYGVEDSTLLVAEWPSWFLLQWL